MGFHDVFSPIVDSIRFFVGNCFAKIAPTRSDAWFIPRRRAHVVGAQISRFGRFGHAVGARMRLPAVTVYHAG
jgi:hypothetical protein